MMTKMTALSLVALVATAAPVAAQRGDRAQDWLDDCNNGRWSSDRARRCEVRDVTIASPSGTLRVDGGRNGGVQVEGESRRDVHVEARLQAEAESESDARDMLQQIRIVTDAGTIRADGPERGDRRSWSVSFVVTTPSRMDLDLRAHNGGIAVRDVVGRMQFQTENGGIRLEGIGGDVRGETTNGGVHVDLVGEKWEGAGLDVSSHNGGIRLSIPSRYAAHLETGTQNGHVAIDFPVTVQGRIGRRIETDLNGGGPPIRVTTTNGGVDITRR